MLILSISIFHKLKDHLEELRIHFGIGKNRRFFPVHEIYQHLGEEKALALPFFHAFTDCDQVPFMSFIRKNTAWKIWNSFDEATTVFMKLSDQPTIEDVKKVMPTINRLPYFCTIRHLIPCQQTSVDGSYFVKEEKLTIFNLQKQLCRNIHVEVLTLLGLTGVSQPFQRKNYHLQRNGAGNFKTENIPHIGPSYQKRLLQLEI